MATQLPNNPQVFDTIRKISAELVGTEGDYSVLRADEVDDDWRTRTDFLVRKAPRGPAPQEPS